MYVAGGGVAEALVQRSNIGRPIAAAEACMRSMAPSGEEQAKALKVRCFKSSHRYVQLATAVSAQCPLTAWHH